MKMTMNIDEDVLEEVMETFKFVSKTDAVNGALREMIRIKKLREFGKNGLGLTKEELMNAVDPDYDPMEFRRVAEPRATYGKKDGNSDPR